MNAEQQEQFLDTVKFEKRDVENNLVRNMGVTKKIRESFNYVYDSLFKLKHFQDISKSKKPNLKKKYLREGKSYHWLAVKCNDIKFLIRQYGMHLTIFVKVKKEYDTEYGAFTYYINTDKMTGEEGDRMRDLFYDEPFYELNNMLLDIIKLLNERDFGFLWNSVSLKRPDYCEIKQAFNRNEFYSIDTTIFCLEEIACLQLELFAENEMLEKLKTLKHIVGQKFDRDSIIIEVRTDFPKQYSDPYYHGVGIITRDEKNYERIHDVYTLSRYHLKEVYKY